MFFETVLVLILSIAFWIVKFLDCYEPTWANLSQLEPTCGPKWPNGAAHAIASSGQAMEIVEPRFQQP